MMCGGPFSCLTLIVFVFLLATTTNGFVASPQPRGGACTQPLVCSSSCLGYRDVSLHFHHPSNPLPSFSFVWDVELLQTGEDSIANYVAIYQHPLPPIVIEFHRSSQWNASVYRETSYGSSTTLPYSEPIAAFHGDSVQVDRVTVVSSSEDVGVTFTSTGAATHGQLTLKGVTVTQGTVGALFYLNISTTLGYWTTTPVFQLANNATYYRIDQRRNFGYNAIAPTAYRWMTSPYIVPGVPLALPLMMEVLDSSGVRGSWFDQETPTLSASFYDASAGDVAVTYGSSQILDGLIVFYDVAITTSPAGVDAAAPEGTSPWFSAVTLRVELGVNIAALDLPPLRLIPSPFLGSGLRFALRSSLQQLGSSRGLSSISAILGNPFWPEIVVEVTDSSGQWDRSSLMDGYLVRASCRTASLDNAVAAVMGGVAVFSNLQFSGAIGATDNVSTVAEHILTFTASRGAPTMNHEDVTLQPATMLFSQLVQVFTADQYREAVALRLKRQGTWFESQDGDSYVLPKHGRLQQRIQVEAFSRDGETALTTVCNISLVSPAIAGGTLYAVLEYGVATFDNVVLNATSEVSFLEFRCTQNPKVFLRLDPVVFVVDRLLNRTALSLLNESFAMRFEPSALSLFGSSSTRSFGTANMPLPPIVLEILRSDGTVNVEVNDIIVAIFVNQVDVSNAVAVSKGGRVVFPSFTLHQPGSYQLQFVPQVANESRPLADVFRRNIVQSGLLVVAPARTPRYGLKFLPSSAIAFSGQALSVPLGVVLAPICVAVFDSTHVLDPTAANIVMVSAFVRPYGALQGTVNVTVGGDGTACFTALTLSTTAVPVSSRLLFCAVRVANAIDSKVAGWCISSGLLEIVSAVTPTLLSLEPSTDSARQVLVEGAPNTTLPINDVDTFAVIPTLKNDQSLFTARVSLRSSGGRRILPTLAHWTAVAVTSSLPIAASNGSTFPLDTRPGVYPSTSTADFPRLQFDATATAAHSDVAGFHHSITFTSSWMAQRPLRVGRIFGATTHSKVLCVDLAISLSLFSLRGWVSQLALIMGIDADRIEVLRVRPSGAPSQWTGTHLELRFGPPTVSSLDTVPPSALATSFLTLAATCDTPKLSILYRYPQGTVPPFCDGYLLEEQMISLQRCFTTVLDQCACAAPMFAALGTTCDSAPPIAKLCSQLTSCLNTNITTGCSAYGSTLTLQYVLIGVYALVGVLVLVLVYAWRGRWLSLCTRETLSKVSDRSIEYQGLKAYRAEGEPADSNILL